MSGRWKRPRRFDYDVVVVGAGTAGLVSAYVANAARARVLLAERNEMGGDCLNSGCVPSKAFLKAAKAVAQARGAARFGVRFEGEVRVDFRAVMAHVREAVRKVAPHDSVERFEALGIDVRREPARVVGPWEVEVGGVRVTTRSIVVASGATARIPAIPGLSDVPHFTSETFWGLEDLPRRFLVVGGGPVGCELGQALARLGAEVTILEEGARVLAKEEEEVSAFVARALERDGVTLRPGTRLVACGSRSGGGSFARVRDGAGAEEEIPIDALLLAVGRVPRTEGFGLEELGLEKNPDGTLRVDSRLRTNIPSIYACGDVAGPYQLTHAAAHQGWYAAFNALLAPFWSFKATGTPMPRVTYLDPEIARVGLSEAEARAAGVEVDVTRYDLSDLDRAIAEGVDEGFAVYVTRKGTDTILGATIVGPHAGEMLAPVLVAMKAGKGLGTLLSTTLPYPTFAEANKNAAGIWREATLPRLGLALLEWIHRWRRG